MRERLLSLCERDHVSVIFVSGEDVVGVQFDGFIDICSENNIQVICSPAHFDIYGVQGVLTTGALLVDGFDSMCAYSGSVVSINTDDKTTERIYLEFFPNYPKEHLNEDITHEIEEILGDAIMKHKKNQKYN